jgi:glycosyltransferase involved in cell wall biosynthesis
MKSRVLVIASEPMGPRLAGPAIRSLELAGALARAGHEPVIAAPHVDHGTPTGSIPMVQFDRDRAALVLGPMVENVDALLLHPHALFEHPFIGRSARPIVVDLYDPVLFESLRLGDRQRWDRAEFAARTQVAVVRHVLRRGDFFLCASERQRDLWLGALVMAGRVTAVTVQHDAALRGLVDLVPFGIPGEPPRRATGVPCVKGLGPIRHTDKVILWGGGIWDWLDPLTLVRGFARVAAGRDDVHLVFLGTTPPNDRAPVMRLASETRSLASSLGLAGTRVHFRQGWVPYAERGAVLLDADVGVTTHIAHLEARFAFRTRVLDYIWAALPVVCTRGDVIAELVEREGLGLCVDERDEAGLAAALERLLDDAAFAAACRDRLRGIAPRFAWDEAARPLVRFCDAPALAADRRRSRSRLIRDQGRAVATRARGLLREGGPRALARQAWRRLRLFW